MNLYTFKRLKIGDKVRINENETTYRSMIGQIVRVDLIWEGHNVILSDCGCNFLYYEIDKVEEG